MCAGLNSRSITNAASLTSQMSQSIEAELARTGGVSKADSFLESLTSSNPPPPSNNKSSTAPIIGAPPSLDADTLGADLSYFLGDEDDSKSPPNMMGMMGGVPASSQNSKPPAPPGATLCEYTTTTTCRHNNSTLCWQASSALSFLEQNFL